MKLKRKRLNECKHDYWHNGSTYNYFIESPHSWYVSTYATSSNLNEAREQCINNWKRVYGNTNRKGITLHIPQRTPSKYEDS